MINVCMIVHQYYYRDPRVRRYAEALADAGARVDVLCPRDPSQSFTRKRSGIRVFAIPINRGYGGRWSYVLEYGLALILFTARMLALSARNRYQVIHVHSPPDILMFAALIPKIFGAKVILDIHDPMPEFYMSKYDDHMDSILAWFMKLQEKVSSGLASVIITANSNFKENLLKRGAPADKITVVNNVADPKIFSRARYRQRRRQDDHFKLIYPGTIAPRYGLDIAIRALPLLVEEIPHLRLVIIGPQVDYADELATLAEELGVSDFVQFRPVLPVDEVPRQLIQADIGIYPALSNPHTDIATPTKVLEYAVMGIPIVASRLKVLQDLFTDSAILFFDPGSVNQFARCVLELYANPGRRDELVRNADRVYVHKHSWTNERSKYFDLLNRLLAPRFNLADVKMEGGGDSQRSGDNRASA